MKRILILAGPTGVGKTDVSIPLALALQGEIISADSRQIFREMEIGTAKPTMKQREQVAHHFVDELSIRERWTAGDFGKAAREKVDGIFERGHLPMVVGGSGFYIRALLDGFFEAEDDESDYEPLRKRLKEEGADALYKELQKVDPESASHIMPQDSSRVLRALEVFERTGTPLSEWHKRPAEPLPYPAAFYCLRMERSVIYERVNQRALNMLKDGLVDEVRGFMERGFDETTNALRTHGYQEVFPYLRGDYGYDEMVDNIQKAVRHYVKRQFTWFRRDERVVWIDCNPEEIPETIAQRIIAHWRQA
ncbi:tRNA (adenosine(37)-N6)-dimethylallyltransferase MiaA [bacterium]|nr:tRNA (adenosine(37)-N6)-dimethylallyltransferase MiaA [bacterium]